MDLYSLIKSLFESLEKPQPPKRVPRFSTWIDPSFRSQAHTVPCIIKSKLPHLPEEVGPASDGGVRKRGEPKRRVLPDLDLRYV